MKLTLNQLQKLELQDVARDLLNQQHYLRALQTFDSSKMPLVSQINHDLMKLTESIKGNRYNPKLRKLLEATVDELKTVKPEFMLDDTVITLLREQAKKDVDNYQAIVVYGDQSQIYKINIQQRADALKMAIIKM